jgi:hypothetical protein
VVALLVVGIGLGASIVWAISPTNDISQPATTRADAPTGSTKTSTQSVTSTDAPISTTSTSTSGPDPFGVATVSYVSGRTGTITAAAYDINTGQSWNLGRSGLQDEASIVKLDILETLLAQSDGQGLSASDQPVAQDMIENSDNDSATDLWDAAGSAAGIASFNSSAGLTDTTPSTCVQCAGFPWPGWGLTTTDPMDQITLLRTIVQRNSLLTTSERNYALELMENVTSSERWGVTGGVPPQATVALKNGWLPLNASDTDWQINSIGWVSGLGRNYLLAVLTTGNPSEQYGIDTIDQISTLVWQDLG